MTVAVRVVQARLLVRPLWRSRAWSLVPLSAGLVLAAVVVLRLGGVAVAAPVPGLAGALVMAGAAAYGFEDATADLIAPAPAPHAFRTGLRAAGTWLLVAACWAVLVGYAATLSRSIALARPTLMLAVLVAVGSLAGLLWGGAAGPPALVAFVVLAALLPDRWSVLEPGRDAGRRLLVVLAALLVTFAARCRDPAR